MALNANLEKTRKDLEKTLANSTAFHVVVGAGDLAVEKLRVVRAELSSRAASFDAKALRDQATTTVAARAGSVQDDVRAAPEQVKALPVKAQAVLEEVVASALSTYGELAGRGKKVVGLVSNQQATTDLKKQAKTTVTQAKAATTTAKKSAASTKTSAKATATTAKKSAAKTKSAAKATTTSAKKTATAAKKATEDTAAKLGD